jgi:hypothetical protein
MLMKTLLTWLYPVSAALAADAPIGWPPEKLVPLNLELPRPAFTHCMAHMPTNAQVEPLRTTPRPPMMVPPGLKNIAPNAKITCSDTNATAQTLAKLTDGHKECMDSQIIYLRKGTQWVQLDFGAPHEVYAVAIWRGQWPLLQAYHDVVVQLSDDADFSTGVQTVFNNDHDNSSQRGIGADREYVETDEGKLVDAKGIKARYLRCYSNGSTDNRLNTYVEIEVYGRPGK